MNLYNALFGFNTACIFFMPMLGRKQEDYPRFRDCFITDDNNIAIYTRVGGNNHGCGYGEEKLYADEHFIRTYDDDFDNTYATYEFRVPEKWKPDFDKLMDGRRNEVSNDYIAMLEAFFPKLAAEGVIRRLLLPEKTKESDTDELLEG